MKRIVSLMLLAVCVGAGFADKAPHCAPATSSSWDGSKASMGLNRVTGNSPSTSSNGEFDLDYRQGRWSNNALAGFQYGKSNGVLNKEQYLYQDQLSYSFNDVATVDNFAFTKGSHQTNEFAAYESQTMVNIGYGRDWCKTATFHISTQLGPAWRRSVEQGTKERRSAMAGVFNVNLDWKITHSMTFSQVLEYTLGKPVNHLVSTTALTNKLIGNLASSFSFAVEDWSSIPSGSSNTKKTNTTTTLNVVYTF